MSFGSIQNNFPIWLWNQFLSKVQVYMDLYTNPSAVLLFKVVKERYFCHKIDGFPVSLMLFSDFLKMLSVIFPCFYETHVEQFIQFNTNYTLTDRIFCICLMLFSYMDQIVRLWQCWTTEGDAVTIKKWLCRFCFVVYKAKHALFLNVLQSRVVNRVF